MEKKKEKTYSKIYTKVGDTGNTKSYHGNMIHKCGDDIELVGKIDELQASIDNARAMFKREHMIGLNVDPIEYSLLIETQRILSILASQVSGYEEAGVPSVNEEKVKQLEDYIDECKLDLTGFVRFDDQMAITLNECRVRTRNFERAMYKRFLTPWQTASVCKYINRLSDVFFAMAYVMERNDI